MRIRIAVVDPLPMFSRGVVETAQSAGFEATTPDDPVGWVRTGGPSIVLLTLLHPRDWALLTELCAVRADSATIAVLDDMGIAECVRALSAGACSIVSRAVGPDTLRATLTAAAAGNSLIPVAVLRAITAPEQRSTGADKAPTEKEITWLRLLAHGSTVANLARHAGYSERMMFRLLRALYGKLRVTNRTEALVYAQERGWL